MAKKKPAAHGGSRPGSGRKPKSDSGPRKTVPLTLSPEVVEFLDDDVGEGKRSDYVDGTVKATKRYKDFRKGKAG